MNPESSIEDLEALFVAYPQEKMEVKIASKKVNNSRNKDFKLENLKDPKDVEGNERGELF